jgi:hypothetical protein
MLSNKINPGDPLKIVFRIFNNEASNAFSRGELVQFVTGSTGDGVKCVRLADNESPCVAGAIEDTTIAAQKYGMVQISGMHDAVLTTTTATAKGVVSATIASSIGKAQAKNAATTLAGDTPAGILGIVIKVTDTNSSAIYLRLM